MSIRQHWSSWWDVYVFVLVVVAIVWAIASASVRDADAACKAMMAKARTSADSVVVYAAKPASRYVTCAEHLLPEAP